MTIVVKPFVWFATSSQICFVIPTKADMNYWVQSESFSNSKTEINTFV